VPDIWVDGKKSRLDPSKILGQGGEAEIYPFGTDQVVKIFKRPDHPDFDGQPEAQAAASRRIEEHQLKLPAFPKGMPGHVVIPDALALDGKGRTVGYVMRMLKGAEVLLRYTQRNFRQAISTEDVISILKGMRITVDAIHKAGAVIGDFNDLNVMVTGKDADFIDADSMQFGKFRCSVFTQRFVDPTLCDPAANSLHLVKAHNENSDWYAFFVMVFQCLLFTDPFGGTYKPHDPTKALVHSARPLKRITVFHPEVKYPKPAIPYGVLPDDLLQRFHLVFERDERGPFPASLLERLHWTKCSGCGAEHARTSCPHCSTIVPEAVKAHVEIRGQVKATRIFQTRGTIVRADLHEGRLIWLYHDNGKFIREDSSRVADGQIDPRLRFRLQGRSTFMARDGIVVKLVGGTSAGRTDADLLGSLTIFDTNDENLFWVHGDSLYKEGRLGPERIGDVLGGQTLFWTGQTFGFGFYRAGQLVRSFVFGTKSGGINDSVKVHLIRGKLIDATCELSKDRAWFLTSTQEGSKTVNRCTVLRPDGAVEASAEAEAGDGSWLSNIRGCCAVNRVLLVPTDQGVVQVKAENGSASVMKTFPDTEPFVDAGMKLIAANAGLYAVSRQEISLLVIS